MPMPIEQRTLLQSIIDHPDDLDRRLVYADWLEEYGDLRHAQEIREQVKDGWIRLIGRIPRTPAISWLMEQLIQKQGSGDPYTGPLEKPLAIWQNGFIVAFAAPTCGTIPWEAIAHNPVKWVTVADRVPGLDGWHLFDMGDPAGLPRAWREWAIKWKDQCGCDLETMGFHDDDDYYQLLSDFIIWYARQQHPLLTSVQS